jgi:outer membrane protein OmpA-like peptidoglycan-associated protein
MMSRTRLIVAAALVGTSASAQPITSQPPTSVIEPSNIDVPDQQPPERAPAPPATAAPPVAPVPAAQPPAPAVQPLRDREDELDHALAVVWFASDSAAVPAAQRDALARAVRWQAAHPDWLLYVEGYADRRGSTAENLRKSQQRADAVRADLVRLGADCDRMVVVAYGDSEPLNSAANSRRVVVRPSDSAYPELAAAQSKRDRASCLAAR